eukprot:6123568-Alexandrium_andersonii.AAC.1
MHTRFLRACVAERQVARAGARAPPECPQNRTPSASLRPTLPLPWPASAAVAPRGREGAGAVWRATRREQSKLIQEA